MGFHLRAALILGILALTNAQEKYRCSENPSIECVFTDGKNECEYSSYYGHYCYTAGVWQYCKVCEEDKLSTTVSTTTENHQGSATSTVSTSTKGPERITTTTTITAPPSTRRSVASEATKSTTTLTTVSTSNPKLDTHKTTNTTIKEESTKTSAPISTESTTTSTISSSSTKASTSKTEKNTTTVKTIKDNPTTTTKTETSPTTSQSVSSTTTSTVPTTTTTTTTIATTTESNPVRYCSMNKEAPCKLSFTYEGKTYHECTGDGSTTGALWCYVTDPRIEYVYCEVCKVDPISTKQMTSSRNPTEPSVQELPLPLKAIPSSEANASSPMAQTQKATSVMPESKSLAPLVSSQTVSVKDLPLDEMQISPKTINSTPLSSTMSTMMPTQPVSSTTSPPKSKTAQKTTLVDRLLSTTTSSARPNLPPIPAATSSEANSHDTPIQMTEPSIKNESLKSAPKTTPIQSVTDSKATSSPTSSTTTTTSKSTTASSAKVKTSTIGSKRPATLTKSTTTTTTLRSSTVKPRGVNPVQLSETDKGASSQDGSGDSDDNENGSDTVMIVVLILVIFAMIVAVAIVVLCIRRRRRRNSIEKGVEVGGAGDKLLKQNGSNGSNKSVSPDGSQEMEPLTSKPNDNNASGDDVVIKGGTNSRSDNITKTVAV